MILRKSQHHLSFNCYSPQTQSLFIPFYFCSGVSLLKITAIRTTPTEPSKPQLKCPLLCEAFTDYHRLLPRILIPCPNSASPPLSAHVLMRAYSLRDYLQWDTHYSGLHITVGRFLETPQIWGSTGLTTLGNCYP